MPRAMAKCSICDDYLWIESKAPVPQAVGCTCGATILDEDGAHGSPATLTAEDEAAIIQKEIDDDRW